MKNIIVILAIVISPMLWGQTDTLRSLGAIDLDLLKMPSNAAFNVMGTTPSEIAMPSSAPEFVIDVQNASDNFSSFPNNYGFSITPYWWIHGKTLSFEDDFSTENKMNPLRHLRVSGGILSGTSTSMNTWRYALGVQTGLLIGMVDSSKKAEYYNKLLGLNRVLFEASEKVLKTVPRYQASEKKINDILNRMQIEGISIEEREALIAELGIAQKEQKQLMNDLKRESIIRAGEMQAKDSLDLYESFNAMSVRYGWKWDVGLATAYDLSNNKLDSSQMYRSGVWTNFGYSLKATTKHQLSFLGALRYYFYDKVIYATDANNLLIENLGVVDAGARVVLTAKKLSVSVEGLYRMSMVEEVENSYKLNGLINYSFSSNRSVYFSFGNAFNETSVGGPDQVSVYIGLNLGFGGKSDIEYKVK